MAKRLFFLVSLILLFACQDRFGGTEDQGSVRTLFDTDSLTTVISKAGAIETPQANQFSFRVENTRGEVLRTWASITEVPSVINLVTGSYRFVAWYGSSEGFPSWDGLYWQGENKLKVESGVTTDAPVVIKLGVVQVSVTFDAASFNKYYSAYSADIRTTTPNTPDAGFLNFTPDDGAKSGRFLPGTLRLRLRLIDKRDGKEYIFSPPVAVGAAVGAEHYNMTLKVDETKGFTTLVVTTDNEVTEIAMDVHNLPASTLPKAPPRVRSIGYDYTGSAVHYSQGVAPSEKLAVAVDATAGVKRLWLKATSPAMQTAWGGASQINLVGISAEQRRLLEMSGFSWPSVLDTPEKAAKATARIEIRFDDLFRKLGANTSDSDAGTLYTFEVEAEDLFDQSSSTTSTFKTELQILPPVFDWRTSVDNVWATQAVFELTGAVDVVGAEPFVEYRRADQTVWERGASTQEVLENGRWRYTIQGLTPSTDYVFRARMGEWTKAEFGQKTEAATQLPNSDMERWDAWIMEAWGFGSDIPNYNPWAKGETGFWATNNGRTTAYNSGGTTSAANCFPAISYSLTAYQGGKAAEVRSVSAVGGNTAEIAYGKTTGILFTGSYSYADSKDNFNYGQSWSTRPMALEFYYTYNSYNNDKFRADIELYDAEGVLLGSGVFVSASGASNSDYIKATIPVTYIGWPARAAKIVVVFRSSTNDSPEVRKLKYKVDFLDGSGNNILANEEWGTHTGSILRVDGLNLVY